jgi:hypothetical protein
MYYKNGLTFVDRKHYKDFKVYYKEAHGKELEPSRNPLDVLREIMRNKDERDGNS